MQLTLRQGEVTYHKSSFPSFSHDVQFVKLRRRKEREA